MGWWGGGGVDSVRTLLSLGLNNNDIKQEFGIETGEYEEYETSIDLTDNE